MSTAKEEEEHEILEKQKRLRPPLFWCKFIVSKPKWAFGITLGGHLFLTSLNFILFLAGYNIMPFEFKRFPVDLKDEVSFQREEAWRFRNSDDPEKVHRFVLDDLGTPPYRGYSTDDVRLFFTDNKDNIFRQDVLQVMKHIEEQIFQNDVYQSKHCQLTELRQCTLPKSVIRYFDGTLRHISPVFYDPDFERISEVFWEAYTNQETSRDFMYFLGKGYSITPTTVFNNVTRTAFPLGWPIENNSTEEDYFVVKTFVKDHFIPEIEDALILSGDTVDVVYISFIIFDINILRDVALDMMLAVGSVAFIFIFIRIVTKSFWITGWSILSIISCFFITNLIYRVVLDFIYIGYFHLVAIFIILGIGADDFFVFFNAWEANRLKEYPSMSHRLSDTFRTAAGTMFFTSFTTMMAFFAGGISPILALGSFGIFTGVLIAVNYISVIIFFPTVVYTHHIFFKGSRWCGCKQTVGQELPTQNSESTEEKKINEPSIIMNGIVSVTDKPQPVTILFVPGDTNNEIHDNQKHPNLCTETETSISALPESEVSKSVEKKIVKENPVTVFFRGPYFRFITHKYIRWVLVVGLLGFIGFCGWSLTTLEVDSEEIKFFTEKTNFGKAMRLEGTAFIPSGDDFVRIYIAWGLEPRDFSDCHKTEYQCDGKQRWDEIFDMNTPPTQLAFLNFCHKLKYGLTEEEKDMLLIRNNTFTNEMEVDCFMDELHEYLQDEEERLNGTVGLSYPLTESNMKQYMELNDKIYEPEKLTPQFYRYFEIAVGNWLSSGYTLNATQDFFKFNPLVGESKDGENTRHPKFHIDQLNTSQSYYGTRLRYAGIQVNLSLSTQELSYLVGLPVRDNWEQFLDEQKQQMPAQLQGGFQLTEITWHWLTVQKKLVDGAVLGIIIGISIAFPVLVLATQNIIVGTFAAINILAITVCVIGVIPLAGWKLDVMVSMNLCLLVGLSVDYVVHLAEGYHLSFRRDRLGRTQDMLQNLGVSVLSGACTTLGAASFMMFAKIQFFLQFGTFLLCTIGFALFFSMVFFTAVMGICGPEGDTGSIVPPVRVLWYLVVGRSAQKHEECDTCSGRGFVEKERDGETGEEGGEEKGKQEGVMDERKEAANGDLNNGQCINRAYEVSVSDEESIDL